MENESDFKDLYEDYWREIEVSGIEIDDDVIRNKLYHTFLKPTKKDKKE